jgi:hypothetical protein
MKKLIFLMLIVSISIAQTISPTLWKKNGADSSITPTNSLWRIYGKHQLKTTNDALHGAMRFSSGNVQVYDTSVANWVTLGEAGTVSGGWTYMAGTTGSTYPTNLTQKIHIRRTADDTTRTSPFNVYGQMSPDTMAGRIYHTGTASFDSSMLTSGFSVTNQNSYALDLDGSTEYLTKNTALNLDMNGSEMITATADCGFETAVHHWYPFGSNPDTLRSNTDKKSGSWSLQITSTGAGDTTSNFIFLEPSYFTAMTVGKTYTIQLWARASIAGTKITMNVGTQSKQSNTLSTVVGTFTITAFNFECTVNDTIKLYLNQTDVVYIDDITLTEAYDFTILCWLYRPTPISLPIGSIINYSFWGGLADYGFRIIKANLSRAIQLHLGYGATSDAQTTVAYDENDSLNIYLLAITIDRSGTAKMYSNGVRMSSSTITSVARMISVTYKNLRIGVNYVTSNLFKGKFGAVQILRGYAITDQEVYNCYKYGIPKRWHSGTVIAHYDWRGSDTTRAFKDISLTGNTLTSSAVTLADDRVNVTVPARIGESTYEGDFSWRKSAYFWGDSVYVDGTIYLGGGGTIQKVLTGSQTYSFGAIGAGVDSTITIAVSGASAGDEVILGYSNAKTNGTEVNAWVASANTVTLCVSNYSASSKTPPATTTYKVKIIK